MSDLEHEKRVAAVAAAALVEDGMTVGLGTGSTVAHLLDALAERRLTGIRCVSTSVRTEQRARELGLAVEDFDALDRLDIAIDGTDQVEPSGWLIKGGGGAHTREKIVAAAAGRFVVIADHTKVVDALTAPVPLELFAFGLSATLAALGDDVAVRAGAPRSPDDGVIADWSGAFADPAALAAQLSGVPGVVDHGLFDRVLVSDVLIARGDDVEHRSIG
jgi:ribose 5-phosphate isomerase A